MKESIRNFGNGSFSLPVLKDSFGQEIYASLSRTDLEFFQYGLDFLSLNKKLEAVNYRHTLSVEKKMDGEIDYLIDLSKCFYPDTTKDSYWIKVKDQQIDIAKILISKEEVSIFSNYSLRITGITNLSTLQVYTDQQVFI